jgi:hypothetical protein
MAAFKDPLVEGGCPMKHRKSRGVWSAVAVASLLMIVGPGLPRSAGSPATLPWTSRRPSRPSWRA